MLDLSISYILKKIVKISTRDEYRLPHHCIYYLIISRPGRARHTAIVTRLGSKNTRYAVELRYVVC